MKHLKTYENLSNEPNVGDYVYVNIDIDNYVVNDEGGDDILKVNNKIGKIIKKSPSSEFLDSIYTYVILIDKSEYTIYSDEIKEFGKSPKEIEIKMIANKYNL